MEDSRVSDPLPFCVGTETKAHGTPWSSVKDASVSAAQLWKTSGTSAHPHYSDAGESESDAAIGTVQEKFCRLQVEAAYDAAFCNETCRTPRTSECNTGGDSSGPSCSDAEAEEDTLTDGELPVGSIGGKCCGLEVGEACSIAFSSETSECQTGATVGDSTVPSFSDTEADADHQLPLEVMGRKCSRLEVEQVLSLAVFSETCESLSRSVESQREAAAAGDGTVPCLSDAEEPRHFEGVAPYQTAGEGSGQTEEPCEGWATDLSTMSSEMEEGMWKEVRHGKRRPLQASKPGTKRVPRVALVALFDAVDAFISETGAAPAGATGVSRGAGRGSPSFATSRRSGPGPRTEPHPQDEAPTEAEMWASKHLQATLEAIAQRLENVERCVQANQAHSPEMSQEAMDEQRLLLLDLERKVAGVMSLRLGEQASRRPLQQARVEALMRRLLRLRDVLQTGGGGGGGGYTELDVQLALKGARRHLRSAQGAAAKLALLLAAAAGGEG